MTVGVFCVHNQVACLYATMLVEADSTEHLATAPSLSGSRPVEAASTLIDVGHQHLNESRCSKALNSMMRVARYVLTVADNATEQKRSQSSTVTVRRRPVEVDDVNGNEQI